MREIGNVEPVPIAVGTRSEIGRSNCSDLRRNLPAPRLDFAAIAAAARRDAPAVLRRILPDGRPEGREWVARNPTRADRRSGSFRINLTTGRWADFATGDRGGDLIALVAYLEGCTQADAARLLARLLGFEEAA